MKRFTQRKTLGTSQVLLDEVINELDGRLPWISPPLPLRLHIDRISTVNNLTQEFSAAISISFLIKIDSLLNTRAPRSIMLERGFDAPYPYLLCTSLFSP